MVYTTSYYCEVKAGKYSGTEPDLALSPSRLNPIAKTTSKE